MDWDAGVARCSYCGYKWTAVAPADRDPAGLECPRCHTMNGEYTGELVLLKSEG